MSRIRVLIVDDYQPFRATVEALLELEGDFEVVAQGGSGSRAVELARDHAPDVIVTDLDMPGMSGDELARRLRESHSTARVLILTGSDVSDDVRLAHAAGAAYLRKDETADRLVDVVRELGTQSNR